jgi:hypothetical protein
MNVAYWDGAAHPLAEQDGFIISELRFGDPAGAGGATGTLEPSTFVRHRSCGNFDRQSYAYQSL